MTITLTCIALQAFLVIGLGFNVSMNRAKTKTNFGYDTDPADPLYKAVRAHGNATEYVPIIALLCFILAQAPLAAWELWSIVLVTLFRYLAAAGILFPATLNRPNPMRFLGALGTYVCGFILCAAVLIRAIQM